MEKELLKWGLATKKTSLRLVRPSEHSYLILMGTVLLGCLFAVSTVSTLYVHAWFRPSSEHKQVQLLAIWRITTCWWQPCKLGRWCLGPALCSAEWCGARVTDRQQHLRNQPRALCARPRGTAAPVPPQQGWHHLQVGAAQGTPDTLQTLITSSPAPRSVQPQLGLVGIYLLI